MKTLLSVLLIVSVVGICFSQDQTLTAKAHGKAVVDAVIAKIHNSGVFADDHNFLRRIAFVESKFGDDTNTYRSGYYGGIWQVDQVGFKETQNTASHSNLKTLHDNVKTKLGINWPAVVWSDLQKPLYSGLAARLFLSNIPAAIPTSVADQAQYWKTYYNTVAGSGTVQKFIDDVKALEG